jgi:hypothetical protein
VGRPADAGPHRSGAAAFPVFDGGLRRHPRRRGSGTRARCVAGQSCSTQTEDRAVLAAKVEASSPIAATPEARSRTVLGGPCHSSGEHQRMVSHQEARV